MTGAKGRESRRIKSLEPDEEKQVKRIRHLFDKYQKISDEITEWEEINTDDADIILCAFGSLARSIKAVMTELRKKGLKVGVFRPITLSPFPHKRLNELAEKCKSFVVVEMNMGQMAKDVKYAVDGKADIYQVNRPVGQWLSVEEIIQEMNNQLGEKVYANV